MPKQCYILTIKSKSQTSYTLNNNIQVQTITYIGLHISEDYKWTIHIFKVEKKEKSKLSIRFHKMKSAILPHEC